MKPAVKEFGTFDEALEHMGITLPSHLRDRVETELKVTAGVDANGKAKRYDIEPSFRNYVQTAGDLLARPREPITFAVEGVLARGRLALMAGPPKVGKGTTTRSLAASISRGADWLGFPTTQGRVLYVALEEHEDDIAADFEQYDVDPDNLLIYVGRKTKNPLADLGVFLQEQTLADTPVSAIIIDPLFRFVDVEDGNNYHETTAKLDPLIHLAHEHEVAVLGVHHTRKGRGGDPFNAIMGSAGIWASFDAGLLYFRSANLESNARLLMIRGRRHVVDGVWTVHMHGSTFTRQTGTPPDKDELELLAALEDGPLTAKEAAELLDVTERTTRRKLKALAKSRDDVECNEDERPYRWHLTSAIDEFNTDDSAPDLSGVSTD